MRATQNDEIDLAINIISLFIKSFLGIKSWISINNVSTHFGIMIDIHILFEYACESASPSQTSLSYL